MNFANICLGSSILIDIPVDGADGIIVVATEAT